MKNVCLLLSALLMACGHQSPQPPQYAHMAGPPHLLMKGSDACLSNECADSCVIAYKDFTVIAKPRTESEGEDITVVMNQSGRKTKLALSDPAQYFFGCCRDKIIMDVGTGNLRRNFIFDIRLQAWTDSIDNILDESEIVEGNLHYYIPMSKARVAGLQLPPCEETGLEAGGYYEEISCDLTTHKRTPTGKRKCVK